MPIEESSRADHALDIATAILIENGYAGLSFRKVAARAGMGLGNLQHYFPTKTDLMRALLDRTFARFDATMAARRGESDDPIKDLTVAIDYALKDQKSEESCVLLWELWALAARDRHASDLLAEFYARYVEHVAQAMRRARADLTPARARRAATLAAALIEGASLFRGARRKPDLAPVGFDSALRATLLRILGDA